MIQLKVQYINFHQEILASLFIDDFLKKNSDSEKLFLKDKKKLSFSILSSNLMKLNKLLFRIYQSEFVFFNESFELTKEKLEEFKAIIEKGFPNFNFNDENFSKYQNIDIEKLPKEIFESIEQYNFYKNSSKDIKDQFLEYKLYVESFYYLSFLTAETCNDSILWFSNKKNSGVGNVRNLYLQHPKKYFANISSWNKGLILQTHEINDFHTIIPISDYTKLEKDEGFYFNLEKFKKYIRRSLEQHLNTLGFNFELIPKINSFVTFYKVHDFDSIINEFYKNRLNINVLFNKL